MNAAELAEHVGRSLHGRGLSVGVAESLTGGQLSATLAQATDASEWFRGGVVAYAADVKHALLGVRPGPVVSEEAAVDLADGAVRLLAADVGLSVTGVGGPGPQDGVPAGVVWVAVAQGGSSTHAERFEFDGEPADVCRQAIEAVLARAVALLDGATR